jgi:hypothetical protein
MAEAYRDDGPNDGRDDEDQPTSDEETESEEAECGGDIDHGNP